MDGVFHVASYGMSGREMLKTELIRAVNVEGTRLVVDICRKHGMHIFLSFLSYPNIFSCTFVDFLSTDENFFPCFTLSLSRYFFP